MPDTTGRSAPTGNEALRRIRTDAVLAALREHGPVSRTGLADLTGYRPSSLTEIVRDLMGSGHVLQVGTGDSSGGRRPRLLAFNPAAETLVVVSLEGDQARAAVVDLAGEPYGEHTRRIDAADPFTGLVALIGEAVAGSTGPVPGRVVFSVPGVATVEGAVTLSPVLRALGDDSLTSTLADRVGLPVRTENDVNLVALGEREQGAAADVDDLVLIYVGYGVGAALVTGGALCRGAAGFAGEIGFLPAGPPPEPHEGGRGRFEQRWSVPGIAAALAGPDGPAPADPVGELARRAGEPEVATLRRSVIEAWAYAAIVCSCVVNPARVVYAGAAVRLGEPGLAELRALVAASAPSAPEVMFAELGARALHVGAVSPAVSSSAVVATRPTP
ncbi:MULTISPECIES: ROK family transcriptional regulator [Thermomonosporaceae]|uniref:ROK family transcriptional regulator n=1 Tax=Thermomonosporaceae TaxID=2012 RepID=UPI00255B3C91|nr:MULTISPECIES: ROK family transcriptional regulator [Thermomonosporaceae]MDL4776851.1 ROK family transcriptional regulator [Actinomadura xylanilytica]